MRPMSRTVQAVLANATAWRQWNSAIEQARREYAIHPNSECRPTCPCRRAKKIAHAEANARYRARKKEQAK